MELTPDQNELLQIVESQRNGAMNESVRLAALLMAAQRRIAELEAKLPTEPVPVEPLKSVA